jgi:transcriptional regulator GlxA family with amidase domain
MVKKVAIIGVNPVNGSGLFQYLEGFFENKIPYRTFAAAETREIKTNSGIKIVFDDVIGNLKGHEDEYDAVIFSCGDAFIKFQDNINKDYNQILLSVIKRFNEKGKILIGHCGAGMLFEIAGIGEGKKVAIHPYAKQFLKKAIGTDDKFTIDGNFYTAQTENSISLLIPKLINVLKN